MFATCRKFFYQHPRTPYYIALGILTLALFSPHLHFVHARWILDTQDFLEYRKHYNHVVLMRARNGEAWPRAE